MRKTSSIVLLSALLGTYSLSNAQVRMITHLSSGDSLAYNVDSVTSLRFTPTAWPHYNSLNAFHTGGPTIWPLTFYTYNLDSLTFSRDSLGYSVLTIIQDTSDWLSDFTSFRINGARQIPGQYFDFLDNFTIGQYEIDTNVTQLPNSYFDQFGDVLVGNYASAVWVGNDIYTGSPPRMFVLDSSAEVIRDAKLYDTNGLFDPPIGEMCLSADSSGTRILSEQYTGIGRALWEYNSRTGSFDTILPLDQESFPITNLSNAVYYKGNPDSILFYSYGDWTDSTPQPANAGYYLYNRKTGKASLVLHYISDFGEREMVNGFDVSPDGKVLLIASTSDLRAPLFIEYNLASKTFDTLPVQWDTAVVNPALWVRYSHDGNYIVYSNYYFGAFSGANVYRPSEIGIVGRATGERQVLQTNPTTEGQWVGVFPQWSPDDKKIVYGSGELAIEPAGYLSNYSLHILKKFW